MREGATGPPGQPGHCWAGPPAESGHLDPSAAVEVSADSSGPTSEPTLKPAEFPTHRIVTNSQLDFVLGH